MSDEEESTNPTDNQVRHTVDQEMRTSYINYAMSVIIGRALPEVRDGLKPVHRRVLYGMHEAGHTADRSYSKSARSVGEVMGKFHPHGDQSIYDTMVRMAQDFSLRYPLVDGQGNFGSIDGDPPAAMRYTESRLDRLSKHMLEDIKKDTVNFQPNFDDSEQEPEVLPARLPNLLLNGSDGIAVGMATKIPPHNLNEVASAVHLHVDRILEEGEENGNPEAPPNIDIGEYMQHLKGPDFPTGATIHGIDGIRDMYETGHGRFHVRSQCEVHDDGDGKRIVITEIPYQVKKAGMLEAIADLVSKETVKGIRDIRDESSKEGIRVVIEVKQNADPHAVLNQLYRSSRLQESYSANMMGIVNREPVQLTLPIILHSYVRHREEVIRRRTQFDLAKAEARAHVLEGLVKAQARIDDVVAAGKGAESREHFEQILRGEVTFESIPVFDFTAPQAKAIAERRLYQLSKMDTKKVDDEFTELKLAIAEYNAILGSRGRQLEILLSELDEMVEKHGDERRTEIDPMPLSMDREDLVEERAIVISLSEDNYIRHIPVEAFNVQKRGGKGKKGVVTKDEDFPKSITTCFSKDRLLIFTNRPATKMVDGNEITYNEGRVYGLKAWETPQGSRTSRGTHIRNCLELKEDETVVSIIAVDRHLIDNVVKLMGEYNPMEKRVKAGENLTEEEKIRFEQLQKEVMIDSLAFATQKGIIKKSQLRHYAKINRKGKVCINLAEDDSLVTVRHGTNDDDVVLISNNGRAVRFDFETIRPQGRTAGGVRGINLEDGCHLVGMMMAGKQERDNTWVLTITKLGMCKRTRIGSGEMFDKEDKDGNKIPDPKYQSGESKHEYLRYRDGYAIVRRGGKGARTMKFNDGDEIARAHQIPNEDDQILLLSKKGTVIRINANKTAELKGKVGKGTRIMDLRDKNDKSKFVDEVIFSSRLPAELVAKKDDFDSLDTNQDGVIDREEFQAAQQEIVGGEEE